MDPETILSFVNAQIHQDKSQRGCWSVGRFIAELKSLKPDTLVIPKLKFPHSYRGYYEDLAFEHEEDFQTAEELIDLLKSCVGQVYAGYKGGEYRCQDSTFVWLGSYGTTAGSIAVTGLDFHPDAGTVEIIGVPDKY